MYFCPYIRTMPGQFKKFFSGFGPCSLSVELVLCDGSETYFFSSYGKWWWLVSFLMCGWGFAVQELKQINSHAWNQMWTFLYVNYFPEENICPSCSCRSEWWWRTRPGSWKKISLADSEDFARTNLQCTRLKWQKRVFLNNCFLRCFPVECTATSHTYALKVGSFEFVVPFSLCYVI